MKRSTVRANRRARTIHFGRKITTKQETRDYWQCGKSLTECLGYMLDNEVSCDVTFCLGDKKEEIKAHKTILIARSPVFEAMLDGPMKEADNITIPDIAPNIFKLILRYVYTDTDTINLTADNVLSVLYGSKKYCIDTLSEKCSKFLESCLTDDTVCLLYGQSHLYEERELHEKCFKHFLKNPHTCLKSSHFLDLCPECCQSIISSDELSVKEEVIFESVLKWSAKECERKQLEGTNENKREVLGKIIFDVRFPLIDNDYFAKNILNEDLLSDAEKVCVVKHHYGVATDTDSSFSLKKRRRVVYSNNDHERILRFEIKSEPKSNVNNSNEINYLQFEVSSDLVLHGVVVYGDDKSSRCNIKLNIIESDFGTISAVRTDYSTTSADPLYNVMLDSPVCLTANTRYTIKSLIYGPDTFLGGREYLNPVDFHNIKVTFYNSAGCFNRTSVNKGQFPGLLLSEV